MIRELIVSGGLGNQLFILLQAYRIKEESNMPVVLNISKYVKRYKELREFSLDQIIPTLGEEFKIERGKTAYLRFLFTHFLKKLITKFNSYMSFSKDEFSINYFPGKTISMSYFQHINDSSLDKKALNKLRSKISPFFNGEKINRLAIHLRRGDYLLETHLMHGILRKEVFIKEAKILTKKFKFDGITIFTDSPSLVNKKDFWEAHRNVQIDETSDPCISLRKMSLHSAIIASNSTFSLWAGLIGTPKIFKIPSNWSPNKSSDNLGLNWLEKYESDFENN